MEFNSEPSTIMHIDLNSCFATIEQQANPYLRGKPIAVAAYDSSNGCILAPSVEAKKYGVKTGMRVKDGRLLCSSLLVFPPDPAKYRFVHLKLRNILKNYTNDFVPKSIDEFVLNFFGYPAFTQGLLNIGNEIKKRIKDEIGEWLTVSIGISTNRFLAKTGAGLHKPDGLDEINKDNYLKIYENLKLTDLCGIKDRNSMRLNLMGIFNVRQFYGAPLWKLKTAFTSVNGYYWHTRLRGYEIDDIEFGRRSFGNSYALPKPFLPSELGPIMTKLVEKTSFRLRRHGYKARGVHVALYFRDRKFWHRGEMLPNAVFDSRDIYRQMQRILRLCQHVSSVRNLAISCFNLEKTTDLQLEFFGDIAKKEKLSRAVDSINNRWGNFVLFPARMIETSQYVQDKIAFGGVREL